LIGIVFLYTSSLHFRWPRIINIAVFFFQFREFRQARESEMCGRFARYSLLRELARHFKAEPDACDLPPSFNVAPSQEIAVIIHHEDARHIGKRRWGLVPFWAKDSSIGSRLINARVETLSAKPAFKAALKHRRCLIPANGFYEWQGRAGQKQPYYLCLPSGEPFAFAGLYEVWEDRAAPAGAGPYKSCVIITMDASDSVKDIHHRMPLILKPEAYDAWLDPENKDPGGLEELLRTQYVKELKSHPVSRRVNRVENDSRDCLEPLHGS
jgi:putative SOS response-associated peptidase YedK